MRNSWALAIFLTVASVNCSFAANKDHDPCVKEGGSPDQKIEACTRVIDDKRETKKNRSAAYDNRGNA